MNKLRIISTVSAAIAIAFALNITGSFANPVSANMHTIVLDNQSGSGGTEYVTATTGQPLPDRIVPPNSPFPSQVFGGYYTEPNIGGTRFYNSNGNRVFGELWNGTTNITLFARWANPALELLLEHNNGTGDYEYSGWFLPESARRPILPESITPPKPPTPLHVFWGYYSSRNVTDNTVRYFDENGLRAWRVSLVQETESPIHRVAYAHFVQTRFPLVFENNGGMGEFDEIILERPVVDGEILNAEFPDLVTPPTRSNYTFNGYFFERDGVRFTAFNADGTRAYVGEFDSVEPITVSALWRCEKCSEFENQCVCVAETTSPVTTQTTSTETTETTPTTTQTSSTETTETTPTETTTEPTIPTPERGGAFGLGRVTDSSPEPSIADALAILRYLVGLSNPITQCEDARAAALITNTNSPNPTIQDALAILRFVVGLSSPVLDEVWR
ncbi:MAG: hypothetical protein FWG45_02375 [Oscillospiraceae bacterium]|nr:hypothetical protein [Oscillospiraceae bacterium]